ncbi:hypothetical protein QQ045_013475 [Rhodiola kirilowii]
MHIPRINSHVLALIPKSHQATRPEDFIPISCCNVVYIVIASILADRVKRVLPGLIDLAQGAFISERSIVGNICLAQQILSGYGRKNISERLAWKIDIRKAYDTVNWDFLESMTLVDYFPGKRGLLHGDPLSPFLFTIVMEYLSRSLNALTRKDGFYFHPKYHRIKLSHILFTDDLFIFINGRKEAFQAIRSVVDNFLACSGLSINLDKSQIFVTGKKDDKKTWIESFIDTRISSLPQISWS